MSKYTPLQAYLSGQSEIEGELALTSPVTATAPYRAWWGGALSDNGAPNAWLVVGFRSTQIDVENQTLRLVRAGDPVQLRLPSSEAPVVDALRLALSGTVRFVDAEEA